MDTLHPSDQKGNPLKKTCNGECGRTLPATTEFWHRSKKGKHGLRSHCKQCQSEHHQKTKDPRKRRDQNLRRNYGITSKQYDRMLEEQDGVCKVCKLPETRTEPRASDEMIRYLVVDHDHDTGQIRGLLCAECNAALGMLKEDENRILALLEYLQNAKSLDPIERVIQLKLVE